MRARELVALATLVVTVSGCARRQANHPHPESRYYDIQPSETCTESSPHALPPTRVSDTLTREGAQFGYILDAWLARRVPGGWAAGPRPVTWGGPALLWLRDPSQKRVVATMLDSLRGQLPAHYARMPLPDSIVALEVRWDAAELYDWYRYLLWTRSHALPRDAGYNSTSLNGTRGRIVLGISKLETIPAFVEWARSERIPCNLIAVYQSGPFSVSSASAASGH